MSNVVVSFIIHDNICTKIQISLYRDIYDRVRKCICICTVFSSFQDPTCGEPSLRSATSRRNLGGVAILTCKSFVMLGERSERQTEPPRSGVPLQCPSGELPFDRLIK